LVEKCLKKVQHQDLSFNFIFKVMNRASFKLIEQYKGTTRWEYESRRRRYDLTHNSSTNLFSLIDLGTGTGYAYWVNREYDDMREILRVLKLSEPEDFSQYKPIN